MLDGGEGAAFRIEQVEPGILLPLAVARDEQVMVRFVHQSTYDTRFGELDPVDS
jgi:hypothetical protein